MQHIQVLNGKSLIEAAKLMTAARACEPSVTDAGPCGAGATDSCTHYDGGICIGTLSDDTCDWDYGSCTGGATDWCGLTDASDSGCSGTKGNDVCGQVDNSGPCYKDTCANNDSNNKNCFLIDFNPCTSGEDTCGGSQNDTAC